MGAMDAGSIAMASGNIAGGLGTFAGAAGPYVLAAMAAANCSAAAKPAPAASNGTNLRWPRPAWRQIDAANITGAIGTTQASINAHLARFGSSTRLSEFFSGLETSDSGRASPMPAAHLHRPRVQPRPEWLADMNRRGNFDAAGAVTAFGEELSQSVLQACRPIWTTCRTTSAKYLDGIDVDAMGKDAADKLLASIDAVATQRATLEQQIYELTTSDAQKLLDTCAKEREAIDASNRPLLDRVYAPAGRKNRRRCRAAAAAQERARIQEQVAQQRQNLQTQLWQLEGNTAALRGAELAALDPSNRALQQHIWALQDQAAAAEVRPPRRKSTTRA